jgi:hypothetical protein
VGHEWSQVEGHGTGTGLWWLGTSGSDALELRAGGSRALRLEPGAWSPNSIGGYSGNWVVSGAQGATIAGGGGSEGPPGVPVPNRVTDQGGTVGGGANNQAGDDAGTTDDAWFAAVAGGRANVASASQATVGGGWNNTASGVSATVAGGYDNTASGYVATVGGGDDNTASDTYCTTGGGYFNTASGFSATVGGGYANGAAGGSATVGGGQGNSASVLGATVGGGLYNTASGGSATISGGESNTASGHAATVGGGEANTASGDQATIGGGNSNTTGAERATIGGGDSNTASGSYSTVGGGIENEASGQSATVGGGWANVASGERATVGGGGENIASGGNATVPGGWLNTAQGDRSFAAGYRAKANNIGCFVWGDSTDADVACDSDNGFVVRASGNVWFGTTSSPDLATGFINTSTGAYLSSAGVWTDNSDRDAKENFTPVDGQEVLASLAEMPITTWNYKAQDGDIRHMGPVGQDFYAAFGLGEDESHIAALDSSGVALAAIQGLYQLSQEQAARIQALEADNVSLQQRLDDLEARVTALEGGASTSSVEKSAKFPSRSY